MMQFGWDDVHKHSDFATLIESILDMFATGCQGLDRLTLSQPTAAGVQADSLIQPAWMAGRALGVKIANVFYDNPKLNLPTVMGGYLLFDGNTGAPLAYIDGVAETFVKTAANSAAASKVLSRPDSSVLLMMGAGNLAPYLIRAHATARPIRKVLVNNRTRANAEKLAATLSIPGIDIEVADDTAAAARQADIICCATFATTPILKGAWLSPGCHVDLVGGYRPDQREADDDVAARAGGRLYVDARQTTVKVAGDVMEPLARGIIPADGIVDMFELVGGKQPGRKGRDDITVFKSGGGGHEDLAVAIALYRKAGGTFSIPW